MAPLNAEGGFLYRKIGRPILALLTQGVTPQKIALTLALGLSLGVFPVLGSTSILCGVAAAALGLNLPIIQIANWVAYPLQFVFLMPFIRMGEAIFHAPRLPFDLGQMLAMARASLPHAIAILWATALRAVVAWALTMAILLPLLYLALLVVVKFFAQHASSLRTKEV